MPCLKIIGAGCRRKVDLDGEGAAKHAADNGADHGAERTADRGAGQGHDHSEGSLHEPLLDDERLMRVCQTRELALLRDVPPELVHRSNMQSLSLSSAAGLTASSARASESGASGKSSRLRRGRSSVVMSIGSVVNLGKALAGGAGSAESEGSVSERRRPRGRARSV